MNTNFRTTIRQAQHALDRRGIALEIVRGEGYHYFIYDQVAHGIYETQSVMIPYTSHVTAEGWADLAETALAQIKARL